MPEALLPDRADLDLFIQAEPQPQVEHPLHTDESEVLRKSIGASVPQAEQITKWLTKLTLSVRRVAVTMLAFFADRQLWPWILMPLEASGESRRF